MTTIQEAYAVFIAPLSKRFSTPPGSDQDAFFEDLAAELSKFTRYQLECAASEITRTRTQRGFPTFAECIAAADRMSPERPQPTGRPLPGSPLDDWKIKKDAERTAAALCRGPMGERALREGWLTSLLEYATEHGRLPREIEITRVKAMSEKADRAADVPGQLGPMLMTLRQAMKDRAKERVFGAEFKQAAE